MDNQKSTAESPSFENSIAGRRQTSFRVSPRWTRVALVVLAALIGFFLIQFENLYLLGFSILAFFFFIGIFYKRSWAIYLLLVTLIFLKVVSVDPGNNYLLKILRPLDLVFTSAAMFFAAICFRYLELSRVVDAYFPTIGKPQSLIREPIRPDKSALLFPSFFGGRWWLIPMSMAIAFGLLQVFPYDEQSARQWITVSGRRLIYLTFFLFFCWFVCRSIVALVLRWNMEPEQACIRARSLIAKEFWNEVYPVERRRVKIRDRNRVE